MCLDVCPKPLTPLKLAQTHSCALPKRIDETAGGYGYNEPPPSPPHLPLPLPLPHPTPTIVSLVGFPV